MGHILGRARQQTPYYTAKTGKECWSGPRTQTNSVSKQSNGLRVYESMSFVLKKGKRAKKVLNRTVGTYDAAFKTFTC